MKKESNLIKSTFVIMIVSLLSRVIGFLRDMLIGYKFGAGMYTDAYNVAVTIPETIFTLVGLSISTAFLPMLSKIRSDKDENEMYLFANRIINILFVCSIVLFLIGSIFSKEIVNFLTNKSTETGKGFSYETYVLAVRLTRITLINLIFLTINACFTAMLQVNEDFIIPSILGLFFNFPMIVYLILFNDYNIMGLTIANVIGNLFRVLVQIPSLIHHNYHYRLIIDFKDRYLKRMFIIILPVIVGAGANSLNMIADMKIASSLNEGTISALNYAQKIIILINSSITAAVSSVSYPMMANLLNEKKISEFINILKKSIIYLAIILIPVSAGVIVFGSKIINIIYVYDGGKFDSVAANLTTLALCGYSTGIFFTGMRDILNSTLFSMGKTKITALNGIIGVIINVILNIILSKIIGIQGIAAASSIAMLVTAVLLFKNILKLQNNLKIKDIIKKIGIILFNSIIMGIIISIYVTICEEKLMMQSSGKIQSIVFVGVGTFIGMSVYFALCYMFKLEEFTEIKNIMFKKLLKK